MGIPNAYHLATSFLICAIATGLAAQTEAQSGKIQIELNTITETEDGCTLTFMVTNGHSAPIDELIYETVLFDASGGVDRLTLFDFGALPAGKQRVRQFAVPDLTCDSMGRVLFNGLHSCKAGSPGNDACLGEMTPTSRVPVEVLG